MSYRTLALIGADDDTDYAKVIEQAGQSVLSMASGIARQQQEKKAKEKSVAEGKVALAAAIAADGNAKSALGQALYSSSEADKAVAESALSAMIAAGAMVPPERQGERLAAAQAGVKSAAEDYARKARGKDVQATNSAKAYWTAAQRIATMVASAQMKSAAQTGLPVPVEERPFLSRGAKIGIGVGVGAVVLAVIGLLIRKLW